MRPGRRLAVLLTGLLVGLTGLVTVGSTPPDATAAAVTADDPVTSSAVTVKGRPGVFGDDFSDLEITVAQTANLTSQGVVVTWKGGKPTKGRGDDPAATDYLQFMQCWGADPKAKDFRETCQVGGSPVPARAPSGVDQRCPEKGPPPNGKPCESLPPDAQMVPFRTADGKTTPHGGKAQPWPQKPCGPPEKKLTCPSTEADILADYFSVYTTNEIPKAVTAADGTGRAVFEVQTATEAAHLGCGAPGHLRCWLLIVPRGDRDRAGNPTEQVEGSPLGASVFSDAIPVALDFQPVGAFCPLDRAERRTVGSELVANAVYSWQPALCAGNGPVFGYSTTSDDDAARQLLDPTDGAPGLVFTSYPVQSPPGGPKIVHAPVALSAVVIAFNIDFRVDPGATDGRAGTVVRDLNLTPRLVAKLLTQSYKRDIPGSNEPAYDYLKDNPRTIRTDKEFLDANPAFADYASNPNLDGLMVSIGNSSAAQEIWRWILADPAARDWLTGKPDENGMVVNKEYPQLFTGGPAPTSFPRQDLGCFTPPDQDKYCALDLRPYQGSLGEAGYQTLRADAKNRTSWDPTVYPKGAYKAFPPQQVTQRFAASVTDAATAARYGLFTAKLRNRAGEFVAPTADALLKAADAMVPSGTDGVRVIDPTASVPGAYPLGLLTYAAADTSEPAADRRDYATLIRYAADKGQVSGVERGQLPLGYVPLPRDLRAQAETAATALQNAKSPTTAPPAPPPAGPAAGAPSATTSATANQGAAPGGPAAPPAPAAPPVPAVSVPPPRAAPPSPSGKPVAQLTQGQPIGNIRYVLLAVLGLGAAAALTGPLLRAAGRRRPPGAPR
ncbi:hypothetical protein ACFY3U_08635 [Micromonospora sp. NPDC000089]|uniref:hypothetical protein n=1 Tax=unclassified Micromonospora TaxID=2617518 RepID=UPI0036882D5D